MRALPMLVAASLALGAPAGAATVRVFAVGAKVRIADGVSYGSFATKMAALMDASHPARASVVQPGVDDVRSHVRPTDPAAPADALVLFPENVGLVAGLIGSRGAGARAQTTAIGSLGGLLVPYASQFTYYATKYPGQPTIRYLVLALTDTYYRSFYETFRALAIAHGVHLSASVNVAPARRVEASADPALVALLRDPDEPGRTYAYEADSPRATNATFVFAPDGEVLISDGAGGTRRSPSETGGVIMPSNEKPYLTEIEQPPPGTAVGLALAFGTVRDGEVLDTPVGRLAIVNSKPAWMIDVNDRFAAKDANVILQPEAFSGWGFEAEPWEPDILKEGGFANLQKNMGFLLNVAACLTGNFFDITFDGQTSILGRQAKTSPGPLGSTNAWVGQNPDTGFLAVGPWIVPDPGVANPALPLAARRAALAASGANLLPGSGVPCPDPLVPGACENGYREAIVWTDAVLPDGPPSAPVDPVRAAPPAFGASVRVSGDEAVPIAQRAPRVAASRKRVYVVWHEERAGLPRVFLAVSEDEGRTFSPPIPASDNPEGTVAELHPAVAARGNRVVVVWQEFAEGLDDDRGRVKLARFSRAGRKRGHDVRVDDHDGSGAWLPVVAFAGATPVVAWIDERDHGPEDEPLEHVYAARGRAGGRRFDPAVRVDAGAPVPLALHLDNKWSPAIVARGRRVYVAWTDFRSYNWDVFVARSDDRGRSFEANVRADDFAGFERIHERPTLGLDRHGRLHVAWTDLRARAPDTNVFYTSSDDDAASFAPNRQLDDSNAGFDPDRDTPSNQWHPSLAAARDALFVAWQDNRLGNDDVFFTTSADGGVTFAPAERVDDTGTGRSVQTRPTLAVGRRGKRLTCYVAWEDDRNGTSDVYLASRSCGGS